MKQLAVFVFCLLRVLYRAVFTRSTIFHLHFSQQVARCAKAYSALYCALCAVRMSFTAMPVKTHSCILVAHSVRRCLFWGLRGARHFIALTPFWSQYYIEKGIVASSRVLVLPTPAQIPDCEPSRELECHIEFLFLGRVGTRKGTFDLIFAFAALPLPYGAAAT